MTGAEAAMQNWSDSDVFDLGSYQIGAILPFQYKAPDPVTGNMVYYKVDVNGFPVETSAGSGFVDGFTDAFEKYSLPDPPNPPPDFVNNLVHRPYFMSPALTAADEQQIAFDMASSQMFKDKTSYIVIGDEVRGNLTGYGTGVIDLKTMLTDADFTSLKTFLTFMPRAILREFFMNQIWPSIPWDLNNKASGAIPNDKPLVQDTDIGGSHYKKDMEDAVWAAFVDVFNQANSEYMTKLGLQDPWVWEGQKTDAYYTSQNQDVLDSMRQKFDAFDQVALALDPIAKPIMDDYATLPPLGDIGLEINRENAIKELLKSKEYVVAQAIVDAYRYAKDTIIGGALENPIPVDIINKDGSIIAHKT